MNRLVLVLALVCSACMAQEQSGLSVNPASGNVAALFTMTDEAGRLKNLSLMESVFKGGELGFSVETHHNVPSPFIYERLYRLAEEMPEGSTLMVYLNSHGGGSGNRFIMTAQGGSFRFSKALEYMKKANRPIRRLIMLVDTCHAEGSIQDSTGGDGELLRNLKIAEPTSFLPELPSSYKEDDLPFLSPFLRLVPTDRLYRGRPVFRTEVDYGEDSGVWEELLIVSSSSVEDLSVRGVFASRMASAFNKAKGSKDITVGEFLRRFAESHAGGGQQPHYKVLPDASMFSEPLFGGWYASEMPIRNHGHREAPGGFVPLPRK